MPPKQTFSPAPPAGSSGAPGARRRGSRAANESIPDLRSQQNAHFWQCEEDAFLFHGPLGEPVGLLAKGTVVWEQQRYEDPFRGWWIATGTQEGELGWIDCTNSAGAPLLQDPAIRAEPVWVPVVEKTVVAATSEARSGAGRRGSQKAAATPASAGAAAAASAAGGDSDVVPDAPPGASLDIHQPYNSDGSTGLTLDVVESVWKQAPPLLALYDYYWSSVASLGPSPAMQDWNQTYQMRVEALIHQPDDDGATPADVQARLDAAELELFQFLETFYDTAEEVAVLFVKDQLAPSGERQLKKHPERADAFYYQGLLVVACIDTADGAYGGDEGARKIAVNGFRSYALAAAEGPRNLLYVPLQTLVSFHGYTLLVSTIPPVDTSGCLFAPLRRLRGSPEAEESRTTSPDASPTHVPAPAEMPDVLQLLCREFSEALNLKAHNVAPKVATQTDAATAWTTTLPVTTELYAGRDRRIYIIGGTDRLLPASMPLPVVCDASAAGAALAPGGTQTGRRGSSSSAMRKGSGPMPSMALLRASLTERLRPELLVQWATPLNSDVAVDGCHTVDDLIASSDVADFLKRDAITAVASMLGLQLPVDTIPLPPLPCTLCDAVMENEVRFVVCQNEDRCCRICTHCYTKRLYDFFNASTTGDESVAAVAADPISNDDWRERVSFEDAVRCGADVRRPNAVVLEPSVTRLAHASGLNMRFLPFVYYRLPVASRFATERYCEVELVARASAHILNDKLRRVTSVEEVHATIQQFFACLLQSQSAEAQRFWATELGPRIESTFHGIRSPLDVSRLSPLLVAERVEELTGVQLSPECKLSLASAKPFVEIAAVRPRVKRIRPPRCHVSQVQAEAQRIRGMLSKLLLFWIGYAPKNCNDALQPVYLQKLQPVL